MALQPTTLQEFLSVILYLIFMALFSFYSSRSCCSNSHVDGSMSTFWQNWDFDTAW